MVTFLGQLSCTASTPVFLTCGNYQSIIYFQWKIAGIWTRDILGTKPICYQLSYPGLDWYLKTKLSCILLLMHITKGTNDLCDIIKGCFNNFVEPLSGIIETKVFGESSAASMVAEVSRIIQFKSFSSLTKSFQAKSWSLLPGKLITL